MASAWRRAPGPTGPFTDAKGQLLVNGSTPGASGTNSWLFDPSGFIDDDGQAYLTFGGNGESNARIIKLNSDMVNVSGSAITVTARSFFEASWLFKRNGIYYYTYSNNSATGLRIDYLTSTSPTSGYTYAGTVAAQPPMNNDNNHDADFLYKDSWYHAYHNRIVATEAGIATSYRRNLALERLDFNADGTIKPVTYTTDGVTQLGTLDPYVRVEAETTNAQSGIETETMRRRRHERDAAFRPATGSRSAASTSAAPARGASARASPARRAAGSIEVRLGSADRNAGRHLRRSGTGGAQTWMTVTCDVTWRERREGPGPEVRGRRIQRELLAVRRWRRGGGRSRGERGRGG